MMMKEYIPCPLELDDVCVPEALLPLVEQIAEQVHEKWAKSRYDAGYRYGERRDDVKLLHPDMRPYGELTEEERQYDRDTAMQTIRLLMKLGWKITPPGETGN